MKCIFCNDSDSLEKYSYKGAHKAYSKNFFENNVKLYTCNSCQISFCHNISRKNLDEYYKSVYTASKPIFDRFLEFNSRFFSQVLYYINHVKLEKNIKVLEVGPSALGILPSLKVFQDKIKYYYFDQVEIKHNVQDVIKLGEYFNPYTSKLPKVDLIWMSHSLEHIFPEDLIKVINKYHEALNDGGKIFIEIPHDIKTRNFSVPHTLFFEKKGLIKLFEKLRFKVVAVSEINDKVELLDSNPNMNKKKITKKNFAVTLYSFIQRFLPNKFVKKYAFKHFVLNGPYTNSPIIRLIVQKI